MPDLADRRTSRVDSLADAELLNDMGVGPEAEQPVRRSMTVGRADDPAEREADRMADAALGTLGDFDDATSAVRRQATDDPLGGAEVGPDLQRRIDAKRGGGSPLGERESVAFSQAYGVDLSGVRVHADSEADQLSRSLQADAFTVGNDVFFRGGKFRPGTGEGDHLIGHELAHVATESGGASRSIHRFMSPKEFYDITYEGFFTSRAAAQTTIHTMLEEYHKIGNDGIVPDSKVPAAVAKLKGMIRIAEAYMSDHVDEKGNPDPNRAKRYAGFLQFYNRALSQVEALEDRMGGSVDTTSIPEDTRVSQLTKHYMGDSTPLFEKAGLAMDNLLKEPGQSAEFSIALKIPIGPGFIEGSMKVEGSRDGDDEADRSTDKFEVRAELMISGGVGISGIAEIKAGLGGYVAAKGTGGVQAAKLMEYAMYRRLAESNVVPWEVEAYIFGGSANDRGKRRAERKANATEKEAFGEGGDDDNYAESGGQVAVGAEIDAGVVGIGAEVSGYAGRRTDRKSLEDAGKTAGDKNKKRSSFANTVSGGMRGAQEFTGRESRGIALKVGLTAPFAVELEFAASWLAEKGGDGHKVMKVDSVGLTLSCEEIPLTSLAGDSGAEMIITAIDRIRGYMDAVNDETCDDKEAAVIDSELQNQRDDAIGKAQGALEAAAGIETAEALGFELAYDFKEKKLEFKLTRTTTKSIDLGVVSMEAKKTETVMTLGKEFGGDGEAK